MKKSQLGMLLFVVGAMGFLVLTVYAAMNPFYYNGMTGLLAAVLGNQILLPWLLFSAMGVAGLAICVYETYGRR